MLATLLDYAANKHLNYTHIYLGHLIKTEEDGEKLLDRADAMAWDEVDPCLQVLFEEHLLGVLQSDRGIKNFVSYYTGTPVNIDKVVRTASERAMSRPAVELLQAICDRPDLSEEELIAWGNQLAYKVLASSSVREHLLGLLRFEYTPVGAQAPVAFVMATMFELGRVESPFFDADRGTVELRQIPGMVQKGAPKRAAIFPCLDDEGRESGDLLVYASSSGGSWFDALEMQLRLSPARQGKALLGMIAGQVGTSDAPHDLFERMGKDLLPQAVGGLQPDAVADSLERNLGYGIDRQGLKLKWETTFGSDLRPDYNALFGSVAPTAKLKAGEINITVRPGDLPRFRQVKVGNESFVVFHVEERAGLALGKDNTMAIEPVAMEDLLEWIKARSAKRPPEGTPAA